MCPQQKIGMTQLSGANWDDGEEGHHGMGTNLKNGKNGRGGSVPDE
jgi:hypothetical protein